MSKNQAQNRAGTEWSDEKLMELYMNGDESAFTDLYGRYAARVYGYLSRGFSSRQERDEIHQNIFLKFHQSRSHFESRYSVAQWVLVIAKTTVADHFRKMQRTVLMSNESRAQIENLPTEQSVESDFDIETLSHLSDQERVAVMMRIVDEFSYREISEKLNRSESSVRQVVSRTLRKLRLSVKAGGITS